VPGLLLLGDAAAALDPVTGAGMAQALVSAELLAERLAVQFDPSDDVLVEFDRRRQVLYREAAVLSRLVLSLVRSPRLTQGAIRVLDRCPSVFSHLVGVAAGTRSLLPI
jgi:2-polyprenyl-6-methoxyphenol hydroxylase-like FAD-dependent oxidoreductase